jgi:hypothetical protein
VAIKALAASPTAAPARPPLDARPNPPVPGSVATDHKADATSAWNRSLKRAGAKLPA